MFKLHISSGCAYQRIVPVFWQFARNLALYNKNNRVLLSQALCVIGSLGNLMFKLHINPRTCCEHQISLGNLSHDSAFDKRTLLFKWGTFLGLIELNFRKIMPENIIDMMVGKYVKREMFSFCLVFYDCALNLLTIVHLKK